MVGHCTYGLEAMQCVDTAHDQCGTLCAVGVQCIAGFVETGGTLSTYLFCGGLTFGTSALVFPVHNTTVPAMVSEDVTVRRPLLFWWIHGLQSCGLVPTGSGKRFVTLNAEMTATLPPNKILSDT